MNKLFSLGTVLTKAEMKNLIGGRKVYDCVFSWSDGHVEHTMYTGDSGPQVQCMADNDAMCYGTDCLGADCIGSGAAAC